MGGGVVGKKKKIKVNAPQKLRGKQRERKERRGERRGMCQ